ncbi:hypothetical protein Tco_0070848 [Tanacetum coccineum]
MPSSTITHVSPYPFFFLNQLSPHQITFTTASKPIFTHTKHRHLSNLHVTYQRKPPARDSSGGGGGMGIRVTLIPHFRTATGLAQPGVFSQVTQEVLQVDWSSHIHSLIPLACMTCEDDVQDNVIVKAARIAVSNLHKNTRKLFSETIKDMYNHVSERWEEGCSDCI